MRIAKAKKDDITQKRSLEQPNDSLEQQREQISKIDSDNQVEDRDVKAKRCNVQRQKQYMQCLNTPEKKNELLAYNQKRAARKRELRKRNKDGAMQETNSEQTTQRHSNGKGENESLESMLKWK